MKLINLLSITCLSVAVLSSQALKAQNTLSSAEKKQGWKLLFDGKTSANWKGYNREEVPSEWKIDDGVISFNPDHADADNRPKDLISKQAFKDFDLSLEWKISTNGNSGVLFNVVENPAYAEPYMSGFEMQILDNDGHPDGKIPKHRAGDLYDLIKSSSEPVKPVGQWNHIEVKSLHGHYTFTMNGVKINEFQMHDAAWNEMVAASKFKQWPEFGKATSGKICLQAHGNQVFFRAVKIRKLS